MQKYFSLLLLTSLFCLGCSNAQDGLSVSAFEKRILSGNVQVLDVRTAGEFQSGHLKNAQQADWLNKEQFAERTSYLDKTKPVLVYCASGVRSASAAKWLLDKGFKEVKNLNGGLTSWKLDNKPVDAVANGSQMSMVTYASLIQSSDVVLVDFGAEWCPPCKKMEPVLQQLQKELPNKYQLVKVDGGIDIDVMKAQNVSAIPVFIVYKNGKEIWRKQGIVELSELKAKLTQ